MPGCRTWQEVVGAGAGLQVNRDSPQAQGLIGWWPLDGFNTVSARDPYRKVVEAFSVASPERRFTPTGQGLYFPSTARLSTNYQIPGVFPNGFTLSAWVTPSTASTRTDYLGRWGGGTYQLMLTNATDNGKFTAYMKSVTDGFPRVDSPSAFTIGQQYLLSMTWMSNALSLYVDGLLVGTNTTCVDLETDTLPMVIGRTDDTYDALSTIRDARLCGAWMSPSEAWALYDPRTRYDLYWRKSRSAPKGTVGGGGALLVNPGMTGNMRDLVGGIRG